MALKIYPWKDFALTFHHHRHFQQIRDGKKNILFSRLKGQWKKYWLSPNFPSWILAWFFYGGEIMGTKFKLCYSLSRLLPWEPAHFSTLFFSLNVFWVLNQFPKSFGMQSVHKFRTMWYILICNTWFLKNLFWSFDSWPGWLIVKSCQNLWKGFFKTKVF